MWPKTGWPRRRHPAASLAPRHRCSRTEDVKLQPKLVPIHRSPRDERLGGLGHLRVNNYLKDVTNRSV
jgi:hypothetical protein